MGTGYRIQCDHCGYQLRFDHGVGMMYPLNCKRILERMQKGTFGNEFQSAAKAIRHPGVEASMELYACSACGNLSPAPKISLCAPIGKYTPRTSIFSSGCEGVEGCDYVMDDDIGTRYDVVVANRHPCEACGTEMYRIPIRRETVVDCPNCKRTLKLHQDMLWD